MSTTAHQKALALVTAIRESFPDAVTVYTRGGCYHFFLILQAVFQTAEPFYDSDHVITRIGARYYDITGEVERKNHYNLNQAPDVLARVKEQCKFPSLLDRIKDLKENGELMESRAYEAERIAERLIIFLNNIPEQ